MNPKVSIIIPVYNGSNYLREAIDSALAQSYGNFEILVVNDGSCDNGKTEAIALSYESRIRYFYKENGGVSSALNLGISKMTGEWFSWLSHDDLYTPDKIERQIEFVSGHPEARVVASNFLIINSHGDVISKYKNNLHNIIETGRDALETWIYGCCLIIHKSCFEKVGVFSLKNRTVQDDEMWLKLLRFFKIYYMDSYLCMCRQHPESGTNNLNNTHRIDRYNYFKSIIDDYDISWFYPRYQRNLNERQLQCTTYSWIGNYALRLGSIESATLCYKKSMEANQFAFNSIVTFIVRPNNKALIVKKYNQLTYYLSCLARRIIVKSKIF